MRRVTTCLVLLLASLVLAGCGGSDETAEPDEPPVAESVPTAEVPPADPAEEPSAEPPASGSCVEQQFADQGADHVSALPEDFEYNSFPATSGPHGPTAIWNAYAEPVPEINVLHNLEHGGVVVQYGSAVPAEQVEAITEWYLSSPDGIVLAPLPELDTKVALTAWRHLLTCDAFDETAFSAFRDAYRFNGPEAIPPDLLKPGM
jgi:hypothetical protein